MTKFYSKSAGGFYDSDVHGDNMAEDAKVITDAAYDALFAAQAAGKVITCDSKGKPVATDPPPPAPPTPDDVRAKRNALLVASDWTQLSDAPFTHDTNDAWRAYRQALRDIDPSGEVVWPKPPA